MQPAFKITVNGSNITDLIRDRLLSLEITDKAGVASDRLTLVIDDRDQRLELPKTGAKIECSIGYVGRALVRMGIYVVDEIDVDGPVRRLTIRANAADMGGGIKAPKERSFPNTTFGALVERIAKDNNLKPSISGDLAARNLGHVDQSESDMQLLVRICTEQGATFKAADGRLVVTGRAKGQTASGKTLPPVTINARDCESWTATLSERGNYKSVKAGWQDLAAGERKTVTAGSGEPSITLKQTYASEADAQRAAESKRGVLARGKGSVRVSGFVGDPTMSAERIATLVGFRQGVDGGGWVVDEVTHTIDDGGYKNSIALATPE